MLSPDKTYHIISELANCFINWMGVGMQRNIWRMGILFAWCSDLFVLLFLPLFIVYSIVWNMAHKERERGKTEQIQQITHTWLADLVYMDMFDQVCLWQQIYGKFWATWSQELTHSHEIQQVKYCCLEHSVIAKEVAGLNSCLSTVTSSKATCTEQARRCGNCIVSRRTYLHKVLACDTIWRTVRCGMFRNIARSKLVVNSFVYTVQVLHLISTSN